MNDLTFNLLKIVVSIVTAIITVYLVPYLRNKLKEDKYAQLMEMIEIAVQAAEQTITGEKQGELRKDDVKAFIKAWMADHEIKGIYDYQIDELIESAVFEMNRYK